MSTKYWGQEPTPPYRSKTDLTANNHLASLEKEVERLKRDNYEQAEEIKSIAWMCKECESTFPSMLVKLSLIGEMVCPRCDSRNKIIRAHQVFPLLIKETKAKLKALEEENKALKQEVKDMVAANVKLREVIQKFKLRPGEGRAVEGE